MAKKLPRAIHPTSMHAPGRRPGEALVTPLDEPEALAKGTFAAKEPAAPGLAPAVDERQAEAVRLVRRYSLWAGFGGLIPVPFVDLAAMTGAQIQMLRRLSTLYDVPFSENRGKAIVAGLAGTMIPASSGIGAASLIKGVPLLGVVVGSVVTPALAVGATYAIGMAFIRHFVSGGTLLDFDPPNYHEFIKTQKERPARA
jgi:uncharacterized protein (DUF697 family)